MLTGDQLTQFEVFGFLVVRGMLASEEIERARADFKVGLAAARKGMERSGIRGQLNWSSLRPETPFLASLLEDERFFGAAQQILARMPSGTSQTRTRSTATGPSGTPTWSSPTGGASSSAFTWSRLTATPER